MSIFRITPLTQTPDATAGSTDSGVTDQPVDLTKVEAGDEGPTIVLSGPLSHIYTEALNKTYAKENNTYLPYHLALIKQSEAAAEIQKEGVFVYCCSGDDLDFSGAKKLSDELTSKKVEMPKGEVILAVENSETNIQKYATAMEYLQSRGVRVKYTRSGALEAIRIASERLVNG